MKRSCFLMVALLILTGLAASARPESDKQEVKEKSLAATEGVTVKIRMQSPNDMDTPLQVICLFKHKKSGDTLLEAADEMDKKLGGAISALRNRGEFAGDELETLLLTPPKGAIKPQQLLLVGLGEEESLSLGTLERVGKVSLRTATDLGIKRVAFAPMLRDQGNSKFAVGDVERAVTRGILLAYDTEKRLQKDGLAKRFTLEEWVAEAGEKFFDDTVPGAQKGIEDAKAEIAKRPSAPYASGK
ncbi:MAG: hypothetical protein JOZ17_18210 [Acetobacteraceae bacterium]|nr:hypothetical protein [Acetobacteraceae bacterium]